jgi:hypothetical protein
VGCNGNALNKIYDKLGLLAMDGWAKEVWECASYYGVTLDYPTEALPCERDSNLVDIFLESSKSGKELLGLNRCWISHQAKYLLCLAMANGKYFNPTFLSSPKNQGMSVLQSVCMGRANTS